MRNEARISTLLRVVMGTAAVLTAPSLAAAEGGIPYPGDLGQAVATLLIFAALLAILGKYAWKPVVRQLQRREDDIAAKIEDARKRQTEADDLAREYDEKLRHIERKVDEMLAEGRKEIEKQRKDMVESAHDETRQLLQRAEDDITAASQAARRDLQSETARLAADLAEQFLTESLTDADQDRLFEQSTRQLVRQDAEDVS